MLCLTGDDNVSRRYLSENEVQLLLDTAQHHSLRNYCMIYLAFIHGLRASELLSLQLTDYDPLASTLSIRRIKGGLSTIHPLSPEEGHIISLWLQERSRSSSADSPWFFPSRNHTHITRQRFWQIIRLYGVMAGLTVRVHPHMLRHACGFALAERGNDTRLIQDYLGHRNIRHTVRYTATSPSRFRQAWSSPPRHTLIPEKTRPETSVTQTYHPPHGEDTATALSPPDLSLIHHEYGVMIKNIWQELSSIQHTLRRLDLRAAAGQQGRQCVLNERCTR
ncbi:TPA: tyrosine-type recombinase/integrase [Escherichia coli]|nr:tyrosine-type recombinase/integrase [Escherichia coli]HBL6878056.1 tyrosine-type recombinase/integrase [Escherichia coli]HBL6882855.1 tyrosine-type recombinase/integrase [Escherichia coli]